MFFSKSKQKIRLECTQQALESTREELQTLKNELAGVKHEKKIGEEDIKHLVKMTQEKHEIEFQKKVMKNDRERESAIAEVKDVYRDKLEARLKTEVDNIKEMYTQILERLPNVTARLKGDIYSG